jgi:hypothetical protein
MLLAIQVGSRTEEATAGTCGPKVKSIVNIKMYVPLPRVITLVAAVPGRYDWPFCAVYKVCVLYCSVVL